MNPDYFKEVAKLDRMFNTVCRDLGTSILPVQRLRCQWYLGGCTHEASTLQYYILQHAISEYTTVDFWSVDTRYIRDVRPLNGFSSMVDVLHLVSQVRSFSIRDQQT